MFLKKCDGEWKLEHVGRGYCAGDMHLWWNPRLIAFRSSGFWGAAGSATFQWCNELVKGLKLANHDLFVKGVTNVAGGIDFSPATIII